MTPVSTSDKTQKTIVKKRFYFNSIIIVLCILSLHRFGHLTSLITSNPSFIMHATVVTRLQTNMHGGGLVVVVVS
jgi:hypothetical protein